MYAKLLLYRVQLIIKISLFEISRDDFQELTVLPEPGLFQNRCQLIVHSRSLKLFLTAKKFVPATK
jgi:hypothetical protein